MSKVKGALTLARHIDDHVHIDVHVIRRVDVHPELVMRPSPDVLPKVVQDKQDSTESDEDGEKAARLRPGLVGRGELWERIELGERGGDEVVELVEQVAVRGRVDGLGHRRHRRGGWGRRRRDGECAKAAASATRKEEEV